MLTVPALSWMVTSRWHNARVSSHPRWMTPAMKDLLFHFNNLFFFCYDNNWIVICRGMFVFQRIVNIVEFRFPWQVPGFPLFTCTIDPGTGRSETESVAACDPVPPWRFWLVYQGCQRSCWSVFASLSPLVRKLEDDESWVSKGKVKYGKTALVQLANVVLSE